MLKADYFQKSMVTRAKTTNYQLYDGRTFKASPLEAAIIKSSFVSRLQDIKQLGLVYKVFPGATHTRFSHSLSSADNAIRMYDSIMNKYQSVLRFSAAEIEHYRLVLSLKMLMHDTGHGPHSHEFEDACEQVGQIFDHEAKTDKYFLCDEFLQITKDLGFNYHENSNIQFDSILQDIKDGLIDADKMDYHLQDAYFCGIPTRFDGPRIIDKLELQEIDHDLHLAINQSGLDAFEEFIRLRTRLHNTIYCNPDTLIYRKHLALFIEEYLRLNGKQIEEISNWRDYRIDSIVEEYSVRSIHAKAIYNDNPYTLLVDTRSGIAPEAVESVYQELCYKLGASNVIILHKDIDSPGEKLKKKPFYVLNSGSDLARDVLDLRYYIAGQKDIRNHFIFINPDKFGEAKAELGKILSKVS